MNKLALHFKRNLAQLNKQLEALNKELEDYRRISDSLQPKRHDPAEKVMTAIGDGWFIELTAENAHSLVQKRLVGILGNIDTWSKHISDLEGKYQFLTKAEVNEEGLEYHDIREEYVAEPAINLKSSVTNNAPPKTQMDQFDLDILARLDQLELEEEAESTASSGPRSSKSVSFNDETLELRMKEELVAPRRSVSFKEENPIVPVKSVSFVALDEDARRSVTFSEPPISNPKSSLPLDTSRNNVGLESFAVSPKLVSFGTSSVMKDRIVERFHHDQSPMKAPSIKTEKNVFFISDDGFEHEKPLSPDSKKAVTFISASTESKASVKVSSPPLIAMSESHEIGKLPKSVSWDKLPTLENFKLIDHAAASDEPADSENETKLVKSVSWNNLVSTGGEDANKKLDSPPLIPLRSDDEECELDSLKLVKSVSWHDLPNEESAIRKSKLDSPPLIPMREDANITKELDDDQFKLSKTVSWEVLTNDLSKNSKRKPDSPPPPGRRELVGAMQMKVVERVFSDESEDAYEEESDLENMVLGQHTSLEYIQKREQFIQASYLPSRSSDDAMKELNE